MTIDRPIRRWYHPTPARFFIGVLVVQVLLLLSERFQWFAFNEHKGWTVLIAVGVVGLAVLAMLAWAFVCLCRRRRFQFGIRSLLLFLVAVSLSLGWLAWEMQRARRQREAVERIRELAMVTYDYQVEGKMRFDWAEPSVPEWLRKLLGDDFFCDVVDVTVWVLDPDAYPCFCDNDAIHLGVLTNLEHLYLRGTQVTDAGLKHLMTLANLRTVTLDENQITDAGLQHLSGLTNLEHLSIAGTQVTDEGVKRLQQALPNCKIVR